MTAVTTGISHIAIGVTDMEASLRFYRDVLGMTLTVDRAEKREGERPKNRRACYLRWDDRPGATYVVLDQQIDQAPEGQASKLFSIGVHHLAFRATDVDVLAEKCANAGYEVWFSGSVHDGPANAEPAEGHEVRTAMVFDPDRNIIQFDQWLTA
jgi:catechol 2,3-dioxygenase-like lactoylglutathione lyase family enzyme